MANLNAEEDVRVYAPDTAMKEKLGPNLSFDQVVSPQIVHSAEKVVTESSATILAATLENLDRLQKAAAQLAVGIANKTALKPVIDAAFAVKSSAGLCGYPFASLLAKSLHVYCEQESTPDEARLTTTSLGIVQAQVNGLKIVFTNKITGDGGTVGAAILQELNNLSKES